MSLSLKSVVKRKDFPYRVIEGLALIVQISDEEENKLITLNSTGTFIWERADGSRSIEEMATELSEEFSIPQELALKNTREFAEDMVSRGLFFIKKGDKDGCGTSL